jgi:hypothetical protein
MEGCPRSSSRLGILSKVLCRHSLIFSLYLYSGRIRTTPESNYGDEGLDEETDDHVLSLGLFPGEYLECLGEDRSIFRFEGAWDSRYSIIELFSFLFKREMWLTLQLNLVCTTHLYSIGPLPQGSISS